MKTPATPEGTGGIKIQWKSIPVSSAEILALNDTPKILVPAPGGRKYGQPLAAVLHYRFGTTPYVSEDNYIGIGWADDTTDLSLAPSVLAGSIFFTSTLFASESDAYLTLGDDASGATLLNGSFGTFDVIEDLPISLWRGPEDPLSGGDGTLTVRLLYSIIDGAPPTV